MRIERLLSALIFVALLPVPALAAAKVATLQVKGMVCPS